MSTNFTSFVIKAEREAAEKKELFLHFITFLYFSKPQALPALQYSPLTACYAMLFTLLPRSPRFALAPTAFCCINYALLNPFSSAVGRAILISLFITLRYTLACWCYTHVCIGRTLSVTLALLYVSSSSAFVMTLSHYLF